MSRGLKELLEANMNKLHKRAPLTAGKIKIVNLGVPLIKRNRSRFGGG